MNSPTLSVCKRLSGRAESSSKVSDLTKGPAEDSRSSTRETFPDPDCPTPALSIHRGLTEVETVVPGASKALQMMRPPNTGHLTNSDSLVQKNRGEKKKSWFSMSHNCHRAFEDCLKYRFLNGASSEQGDSLRSGPPQQARLADVKGGERFQSSVERRARHSCWESVTASARGVQGRGGSGREKFLFPDYLP